MPGSKLVLEHGSVWLSKKTVTTGWTLDKGKGDRTYEHEVTFSTTFSTPPKVFAAFSALDIMNDDDLRITCLVNTVTTTGFKFEVSTWGATHVWSCAVGWMAYDKDAAQAQGARIESGRIPLKKTIPGWKLDKGSGKRAHVQKVNFEKSFPNTTTSPSPSSSPLVLCGFCVLDVLVDDDDHHLKLSTKQINHIGFELEVETWKKTKVWGVSVAYIAFEGCLQSSTGARIEMGILPIIKTTPNAKKLSQGNGERKVAHEVAFDSQFSEVPRVLALLSMQDVSTGNDLRIKATPREITEEGFEVEVATWSDTKVFGCHVSWLAFTTGDTKYSSSSSLPSGSPTSSPTTNTTTTTTTTPSSPPPKNDNSDDDDEKEDKTKEKQKGKKDKGKEKAKEKSKEKAKDTDDSNNDDVCKVCMDAKVNTCLVPCGHLCLCQECAEQVKKHKEPCPICRAPIKQVVVTFAS